MPSLNKIVATINSVTISADGTKMSFQAAYADVNGNSATHNLGPVSIGLSDVLTNLAIGAAIAADCNSSFATSWNAENVILFGGAVILGLL